jgi:acyl carrier protein
VNTDRILHDILQIVEDMTDDWETELGGGIGPQTLLVENLGFTSIDVVQLCIALDEHFGSHNLPFQELLMSGEGEYVEDVSVTQLADFIRGRVGLEQAGNPA